MKPENWIKWDVYSRSDRKTKHYLSLFPHIERAEAYGIFVALVELCYQESDGWLQADEDMKSIIADELGKQMPSISLAIAKLIQAKIFIQNEVNGTPFIASARGLREIAKRAEISQVRRESGKKGGTKSGTCKQLLSTSLPIAKQLLSRVDKSRLDEIREDKKQISPDFDLSPDAPKNLRRKKTELKPRGVSHVIWLTDGEFTRLCEEFGLSETEHLIDNLEDYSTMNPAKFKKYTDHFRVLLTFRQRAVESGKTFRIHPQNGPGYYFNRDLQPQTAAFRK